MWLTQVKCSYSLMEMGTFKIIHVETVDKRDINLQSNNMEHEAFIRSKNNIKEKVKCNELLADASWSIRKTMGKTCTFLFNF